VKALPRGRAFITLEETYKPDSFQDLFTKRRGLPPMIRTA
jgi:hypothetical protein